MHLHLWIPLENSITVSSFRLLGDLQELLLLVCLSIPEVEAHKYAFTLYELFLIALLALFFSVPQLLNPDGSSFYDLMKKNVLW